jgi:hypothetical protein
MKTILALIALSLSTLTHAAVGERVTVRGKVMNLDANTVTLKGQAGPIVVPRKFFPEDTKGGLRPGKDASAEVPLVTLVEMNSPHTAKK